jgi:xylulose-5-phosphate/fructose-6-phosphate phosphoketolase
MLLRKKAPKMRIRVVNVTDLMIFGAERSQPLSLTDDDFDSLFTEDLPVHFNYHGYANELKDSLVDQISTESPSQATIKKAARLRPST